MVVLNNVKPRCFLDIEVNFEQIGRIVIELFNDICPKTCDNFLQLCTGEAGIHPVSNKRMCYAGTPIHRIVKDFMIQGGDFENGDGTGGESIYYGMFEDENLTMKHNEAGLVSMANKGKNTNGSQFFILTKPSPHLDGKHVIFGRVVQGMDVVYKLENLEVSKELKHPVDNVRISTTGQLVLVRKSKNQPLKKPITESSSSESESESESGSSSSSDSSSSSSQGEEINIKRHKKKITKKAVVLPEKQLDPEELEKNISLVKEGEVPIVPPNKFLYRKSPPKKPETIKGEEIIMSKKDSDRLIRREDRESGHKSHTDNAKGKIKGRGIVRYRPEKRGNSRSTTPPHWRREQEKIKPLKSTLDQINKDRWRKDSEEAVHENVSSPPSIEKHKNLEREGSRKTRKNDPSFSTEKDLRNRLNKQSLDIEYESSDNGEYDLRQGPKSKVESKNLKSPESRRVVLSKKPEEKSKYKDRLDGGDTLISKNRRENFKDEDLNYKNEQKNDKLDKYSEKCISQNSKKKKVPTATRR